MRPTSTFFRTDKTFHQIVVLEYHRHRPQTTTDALGIKLVAVDGDLASVRMHQPVDAAEQRRLAGSAWAKDHQEFTGLHRQVDALQHRPAAVRFLQTFDRDHCESLPDVAQRRYFILVRSSFSTFAVSRMTS